MIALRAIAVVVLLASGPLPAWAQGPSPLADVDRELNSLCLRLTRAPAADSADIRARLASLWRRRVAILAEVPEPRRAALLGRSTLAPDCYIVAKAAAEPRGGGKKKKAMRRGFKNGGPPAAANGGGAGDPRSLDLNNIIQPLPSVRGPASVPTPGPAPGPSGPMAPGSSDIRDVAQPLQEFSPWPPPAASGRQLLSLAQLGGDAPASTWGEVSDRVILLLRRARFPSWGFYAAPGGFAVLTRIEQLDHQTGMPLAGTQRWAQEVRLASTSVLAGLLTTRRPQGVYRVIAFILTTDPRTGGEVTAPGRMLQLARRWGVSGALDLPHAMRGNPVTGAHRLFAMVYEFESAIGGETAVNSPGRWPLDDHLRSAGIEVRP